MCNSPQNLKPSSSGVCRARAPAAGKAMPPVAAVMMALWLCAVPGAAHADYERGVRAWESRQHAEAIAEWMTAAEAGDSRAMLALGRAYRLGLGALQDYVEAHRWLNLAASRGETEAVAERDELASIMTVEEQAQARALARQWQPGGGGALPAAAVAKEEMAAEEASPPSPAAVREVQAQLNQLGYRAGPADGLWGRQTAAAYRSFLRDSGLPVSDRLTAEARLALSRRAEQQNAGVGASGSGGERQAAGSLPQPEPAQAHEANEAGFSSGTETAVSSGDGRSVGEQVADAAQQFLAFVQTVAALNLVYNQHADAGDVQKAEAVLELVNVLNAIIASLRNRQAGQAEVAEFATVMNEVSASITSEAAVETGYIHGLARRLSDEYGVDAGISSDRGAAAGFQSSLCTGNPDDRPDGCWLEASNMAGCYGWNQWPSQQHETYNWLGGCEGGRLSGHGTLEWRHRHADDEEWHDHTSEGTFVNGKPNGHWVSKFPSGNIAEGPYVDGKLNGHWVWKRADGTVFYECTYVDGDEVNC